MKRVTIAGGGLAGLSLGIALRRRGVPVRVVEATAYPRHRVCGEFISGVTRAELAALGIDDLFEGAARHCTTAWFDARSSVLHRSLPVPALGLSRHCLDDALAARFVALGGELLTSQRWTEDGEGVVWASGRKLERSPWMGLKVHFVGLALEADLEIHLGRSGYVGLTRVEDDRVNVCGLFRRDESLSASTDNVLIKAVGDAGLMKLAERLRAASCDASSLKGVNHFSLGWQAHADERACIGDAAAMIPPFTGNGMSMAFQSALAAVEPVTRWSAGGASWADTTNNLRGIQQRMFASRLRWARVMQALLMNSWSRRVVVALVKTRCVPFDWLYRRVR